MDVRKAFQFEHITWVESKKLLQRSKKAIWIRLSIPKLEGFLPLHTPEISIGCFLSKQSTKEEEREKKNYLVASDFVGVQTSFAGNF